MPVIVCEIFLLLRGFYSFKTSVPWLAIAPIPLTALIVPLLEEWLFRGLFLGVLLRGLKTWPAILVSAGIFRLFIS